MRMVRPEFLSVVRPEPNVMISIESIAIATCERVIRGAQMSDNVPGDRRTER